MERMTAFLGLSLYAYGVYAGVIFIALLFFFLASRK